MPKPLIENPSEEFYAKYRSLLLRVFAGLTKIERMVLIHRYGLPLELANPRAQPTSRGPVVSKQIERRVGDFFKAFLGFKEERPSVEAHKTISEGKRLTPDLIHHLQEHETDLLEIEPRVFEHLVAEFLACHGFSDVAVVGSDPETSADIFAIARVGDLGHRVRYFIEVKRWKHRVGVEVIDRVLGAMIGEREKFGWHAAMIVSVVGFKRMRKYSRTDLDLRGVSLHDRNG